MKKTDQHTGSSFDTFLEEEGILDEVEAVAVKRVVAWQLEKEMKERSITKLALAKALQTSRSQIDRLLDPLNTSVQLDTVARAAHAAGMRLKINLVRDRTDRAPAMAMMVANARAHTPPRAHRKVKFSAD